MCSRPFDGVLEGCAEGSGSRSGLRSGSRSESTLGSRSRVICLVLIVRMRIPPRTRLHPCGQPQHFLLLDFTAYELLPVATGMPSVLVTMETTGDSGKYVGSGLEAPVFGGGSYASERFSKSGEVFSLDNFLLEQAGVKPLPLLQVTALLCRCYFVGPHLLIFVITPQQSGLPVGGNYVPATLGERTRRFRETSFGCQQEKSDCHERAVPWQQKSARFRHNLPSNVLFFFPWLVAAETRVGREIGSGGSSRANLALTSKKLRQEHAEALEPDAVARRPCCQNPGLLAESGWSCLATTVQLLHHKEKS